MIHSSLRLKKYLTPASLVLILFSSLFWGFYFPQSASASIENKLGIRPSPRRMGDRFVGKDPPREYGSIGFINGDERPQPAHPPIRYYTFPGDSLKAVASRFGLHPDEISSPSPLAEEGLLTPGQLLLLPPRVEEMRANHEIIKIPQIMPDSEVVYGTSAADFDVSQYLEDAAGYLAQHREYLGTTSWTPAADVVTRVALENSINPRLLLAIME